MRVLVLANNDFGLYKFRKELLVTLCKENNEVYVSLPYGQMIPLIEEIGCVYIRQEFNRRGTNPFSDMKLMRSYIKQIKEINPDIVLSYTIKPNVYGGLACQATKKPYIVNVTGLGSAIENGGLLQWITTRLYKLGLRKADCVFFQNQSNMHIFLEKKIVKEEHAKLIPGSGVNLENHCLEPYPDNEKEFNFLFVGRIMKDKGINELLEAIKILHQENPNIMLDIVGRCEEDYVSILKTAEDEGIIRYHGLQENVHDFYKKAHCVVLPSYHEGMANVLLEGASTGRPVIATDIPGCRETFEDGETGYSCVAKDANSLLMAMRKILKLTNEVRRDMGLKGRNKVKNEFDRSIIVNAYTQEIYKRKKG